MDKEPRTGKKSEVEKFHLNLFVDHQGKIDIWALTEREREFVDRDVEIGAFIKKMAGECTHLLVCDRSAERDLVWLLLGKEIQQHSIQARKVYSSQHGFDIIWLPWGSEEDFAGYSDIININSSAI